HFSLQSRFAGILVEFAVERRPAMRRRLFCAALVPVVAVLVAASSAPQIPPLKPPDVIFVPTPQKVVDAMLKLARVTSTDVVYDLGSGDGRVPITAAQ